MGDASMEETLVASLSASLPGAVAEVPRASMVGRYVVLGKIGAGAMGVVYAAYDPDLNRKIALKLLRGHAAAAQSLDSSGQRRLVREAQAMAQLGHPNVVAVHDVGVHDGRVFVAMEFVQGVTLREWLVRSQPRPWPEVLAVLVAAGRGLAAAHDQGLVHRDFKPDNVMVADDGRVRVMDFGLARTDQRGASPPVPTPDGESASQPGDDVDLTQRGALIGTPAYMAPEQFDGAATGHATDQFAFCATAWQALYGTRAFAGKSFVELAARVLQGAREEPPANAKVPRWLRRVLERGLEVDPSQRHPSMAALLGALERGAGRRRRVWLGASAGAVALLGLGSWGAWRLQIEHRRTQCELRADDISQAWNGAREANLRAALLSTGVSYAQSTIDHAVPLFDGHAQAWRDSYAELCIATQVDGRRSEALWTASQECLDTRRGELGALVDILVDEADAGAVQGTVSAAANLGQLEPCRDDAELAREGATTGDRAERDALRAQLWRVGGLTATGRLREALVLARTTVAAAEAAGHARLHRLALRIAGDLGERTGAYDESEQLLGEALDLALAADADDDARDAAVGLAYTVGVRRARYDEGLAWARIARGFVVRHGDQDALATARLETAQAQIHADRGEHEAARALHERALAIRANLLGADHPAVATSLTNLATTYHALGAYIEAQGLYERALAILERALGPDHPDVAATLDNLGGLSHAQGAYDEAKRRHERALAIRERALGSTHIDVARSLANLAAAHLAAGSWEEALALNVRAHAIMERALGPEHPDVGRALANIGVVHMAGGAPAKAVPLYEQALAISERVHGPDHLAVADTLNNLAIAQQGLGGHAQAQRLHERSLAIRTAKLGPDDPAVAFALVGLAEAALATGASAVAQVHAERAVALRTRHGSRPWLIATAEFVLARALWAMEDRSRALALARTAREHYLAEGVGQQTAIEAVEVWLRDRQANPVPYER